MEGIDDFETTEDTLRRMDDVGGSSQAETIKAIKREVRKLYAGLDGRKRGKKPHSGKKKPSVE